MAAMNLSPLVRLFFFFLRPAFSRSAFSRSVVCVFEVCVFETPEAATILEVARMG